MQIWIWICILLGNVAWFENFEAQICQGWLMDHWIFSFCLWWPFIIPPVSIKVDEESYQHKSRNGYILSYIMIYFGGLYKEWIHSSNYVHLGLSAPPSPERWLFKASIHHLWAWIYGALPQVWHFGVSTKSWKTYL